MFAFEAFHNLTVRFFTVSEVVMVIALQTLKDACMVVLHRLGVRSLLRVERIHKLLVLLGLLLQLLLEHVLKLVDVVVMLNRQISNILSVGRHKGS